MTRIAIVCTCCMAVLGAMTSVPTAFAATATEAAPAAAAPNTMAKAKAPRKTAAKHADNQFATETEAKGHCSTDTVVWVNLSSKAYHFSNNKNYGKTKRGAYMCQKDSDSSGFHAAKGEKAP